MTVDESESTHTHEGTQGMPILENEQNEGACVRCPGCSYEIFLENTVPLPLEVSVMCPRCGHRHVYQSAEARTATQSAAERFVKREFSTRKTRIVE